MNKIFVFCVAFLASLSVCQGQSYISIKGCVCDEVTKRPIPYVSVVVQETYTGTITDENGKFALDSLKVGDYHLHFSHIGCEARQVHLQSKRDTILQMELSHTVNSLGTVVVSGNERNRSYVPNVVVTRKKIVDNSNQTLGGLLEFESGVALLKNGSGISKPVVHGLYGNRLLLLNNGVPQSGQQWGNDHAPEIDPFSADKITVIKGVSAIEYGGGNLGSVVSIEPKKIVKEPHFHGLVNYTHETNGKGNIVNTRFEKSNKNLAFRINGTLKKYGDRSTSDYYLNNTGTEEANISLQLEKSWKNRTYFDLYASSFNSTLGLLRGATSGNEVNLQLAIQREVPFKTESDFSYVIEAPKQEVSHHLLKLKAKHYIDDDRMLTAFVAAQIDDRKEYDIRRDGRSVIPALSILQYTFNSDIKYTHSFEGDWKFKLGNQNSYAYNTNDVETGILPLIPDYFSLKAGFFSTLSKTSENYYLKAGFRYDIEEQNVAYIKRNTLREVQRIDNSFSNASGIFAFTYNLQDSQTLTLNSGFASRNPAINELYSYGLHQGVSGIERGNQNLKTEKSIKHTLEYKHFSNSNFSFSALLYLQNFKNYIYLQPNGYQRIIRGYFSVWDYEQTDAQLFGVDFSSQFNIHPSLYGILRYSYLKGDDTRNHKDLLFMPPNRIFSSFTYQFPKTYAMKKSIKMEAPELEVTNRFVFEQKNTDFYKPDFAPAPSQYHLLSCKLSTDVIFTNYKIRCYVKAENMLNTSYRDYLNRLRYFADEMGRSIIFGCSFKF